MMRFTTAISLASLSMIVAPVLGYYSFVSKIPNGANVNGVKAVGHVNVNGGGARNSFGNEFSAAGKTWTVDFCRADSDGDGLTNGEELGDPCCEWNEATANTPRWTDGISHPGDASSTSKSALLTSIDCLGTGSSSSSESKSASSSGSVDSNTIQLTTSGTSTIALSTAAGFITLLAALHVVF